MVFKLWALFFVACSCFATAFSCSCVESDLSKSRDDAMRDAFDISQDVYTAVVSSADCKCYPAGQSKETSMLDCVNYAISDNDVVFERIRKRYYCLYGFASTNAFYGFLQCDDLEIKLVTSPTVDVNLEPLPTVLNVTEEGNCGIISFTGEGCQLSYQPCYYNVTVGTVYKGNSDPGYVLATPGPDVLTSCGSFGRLLTLGVEYVVGIGGPCSPISEWSELASYSDDELALLENLQCAENPSVCNGTENPSASNSTDDSINGAAYACLFSGGFLFTLLMTFFFHLCIN